MSRFWFEPTNAEPSAGKRLHRSWARRAPKTRMAVIQLLATGVLAASWGTGLGGPLPLTPSWTADGDQTFAGFGRSVATAGDVNGDGYSDLIVGAHSYTNGQGNEGRALVYHGSASGLAADHSWSAEGDVGVAYFGTSVAGAGDVNGDGYGDVVVGAPGWDGGSGSVGKGYLYLGSAQGLATTPAWTATGVQAFGDFAFSVSGAGDVNGDGFADVLVGARYEPPFGRAYLYLGSAAGLGATASWVADGDQSSQFGVAVAGAGDVNADGYADIAVGACTFTNDQSQEGRVYVYHGGPGGPSTGPSWIAEGDVAGANFGDAVAAAGDVDGDGFSDLVVGASTAFNQGDAYLYRGAAIGLGTTPAWSASGEQAGEHFGFAVATAGDVNADGFADIVIGAYDFDNPQVTEGRSVLYMGSAAGPGAQPVWSAEGDQTQAFFGVSVATAGDVNGDGVSDVVIGAYGYANPDFREGQAFVYYGQAATLAMAAAWTTQANQSLAFLGTDVAIAGDVNGDGYSDLLVGAPYFDLGQSDEGRAFLFHGTPSGPTVSAVWAAEGNLTGAQLGASVAGAGDVNGDGFGDVVIGAPGANGRGRALLFLGSAGGVGLAPAWTAEGDQNGAEFGRAVASAGDVNGDGFGDVLVGARFYDNGQTNEGRGYLYLGSASGLAATPSWVAEGGVAEANFGHALDSAGDVNGDGFSDVVVGAPGWYDLFPNQNIEGAAFVYLGSEAGLGASAAWIAEGEQAGARLGYAVARAGDVNGDGYSDVVVGADQYNSDGGAFAFHGSASGLGATPAWSVDSVGFGAYFGAGVASAGDVDGDGFGDVIVGAPFYSGGQNFEGSAWLYHGSPTGLSTVYDWSQQSNIQGAEYGRAVAGAGDLNGDGFGDVVIGAALANATSAGGRAYMYFGNEGDGLDHAVRQRRASDLAPIAVLGHSESSSSFRVAGLARSPAGRSRLAFEWEVKPFGTPLDGTGLARSPVVDSGFPGAPGSVVQVNALVSGLANGTDYVWRVRVVGSSPLFPHSRWLVLPDNQPGEMDFQTEATTAVAESSTPRAAGGLILEPCHPNPFNPRTTLTYELAEAGPVEIRIFDTMGRTLAVPVSRVVAAGRHQLDWEARDESGKPLASGAYYLRCAAGGEVKTQKMVIMK